MFVELKSRISLLLTCFLVTAAGCSVDEQEVSTVASPSSPVKAILTERSGGGAAGVYSLRLYLVESDGDGNSRDDPVAVITGCDSAEIELEWKSARILALVYDIECTLDIKTSWYSKKQLETHQLVEYVIVPQLRSATGG